MKGEKMYVFYNILIALGCLLSGYLIGSFPTSVVIGKVFFHKDPRDYGSHNPGGTNAGRIFGKKVGFIIIVIDMIKTIAPLWIWWAIFTFGLKFHIKFQQLTGNTLKELAILFHLYQMLNK